MEEATLPPLTGEPSDAPLTVSNLIDNAKMMAVGFGSVGAVIGVIIILLVTCRYCKNRSSEKGRKAHITKLLKKEYKKKRVAEKKAAAITKAEAKKSVKEAKMRAAREAEIIEELRRRRKKNNGIDPDDEDSKRLEEELYTLQQIAAEKKEEANRKEAAENNIQIEFDELGEAMLGSKHTDDGHSSTGGDGHTTNDGNSEDGGKKGGRRRSYSRMSRSTRKSDGTHDDNGTTYGGSDDDDDDDVLFPTNKKKNRSKTKGNKATTTFITIPEPILDDDELVSIPYPKAEEDDPDSLYESRLERERMKSLVPQFAANPKDLSNPRRPVYIPHFSNPIQRETQDEMWGRYHEQGAALEDERWLNHQRSEFERLSRIPQLSPLPPLRRFENVDPNQLSSWRPSTAAAQCRLVNEVPFSL